MNAEQKKKLWEIMSHRDIWKQLEQAVEEASEFILAAQKVKRFRSQSARWAISATLKRFSATERHRFNRGDTTCWKTASSSFTAAY